MCVFFGEWEKKLCAAAAIVVDDDNDELLRARRFSYTRKLELF